MGKKGSFFRVLAAVGVAVMFFIACSNDDKSGGGSNIPTNNNNASIEGLWKSLDTGWLWEFNSDGSGIFTSNAAATSGTYNFTYSAKNGTMIIQFGEDFNGSRINGNFYGFVDNKLILGLWNQVLERIK